MEMVYLFERREKDAFAERAAKYFSENKDCRTYTDEDIKAECYFALRYGLGNDCVVVFKLDGTEPTNYMNLTPRGR